MFICHFPPCPHLFDHQVPQVTLRFQISLECLFSSGRLDLQGGNSQKKERSRRYLDFLIERKVQWHVQNYICPALCTSTLLFNFQSKPCINIAFMLPGLLHSRNQVTFVENDRKVFKYNIHQICISLLFTSYIHFNSSDFKPDRL